MLCNSVELSFLGGLFTYYCESYDIQQEMCYLIRISGRGIYFDKEGI